MMCDAIDAVARAVPHGDPLIREVPRCDRRPSFLPLGRGMARHCHGVAGDRMCTPIAHCCTSVAFAHRVTTYGRTDLKSVNGVGSQLNGETRTDQSSPDLGDTPHGTTLRPRPVDTAVAKARLCPVVSGSTIDAVVAPVSDNVIIAKPAE